MRLRITLAALAVLLAGCEPSFNVDFVATPLADEDAAVTLRLEGVELRKTDGNTDELTRSSTGVYLVDSTVDPVPEDLLSDSKIDGGRYDALKLLLAGDDDLGEVTRPGEPDETIEAGTTTVQFSPVSFSIDEDEDKTTSLVVALDLVLSLSENEDEDGFTLDPLIRVMEIDEASSVIGNIPASRFGDATCSTGMALVYAFVGRDIEPDERDGTGVEPYATAPIVRRGSGAAATYLLDYLPPGEYTLAFTCQGELENGRLHSEDEDIEFFEGGEVTLEAGENVRVDFDS